MNRVFIFWGEEAELSKYYSLSLNAHLIQIYFKKLSKFKSLVFLRYFLQFVKTIFILFKEKPKLVIVQNPPIFAPLTVWFYCLFTNSKFIIDSHTASFLDRKWKLFHWLFKFLGERAILNTCHNYKNLEILEKWKIKSGRSVPFFNPAYKKEFLEESLQDEILKAAVLKSSLPIFMVNRFARDDDWKTVLETAKLMPEADFFITGRPKKKDKAYIKKTPGNVFFTGYISNIEFIKLMNQCRIVLCLTLRSDTKLWSIQEALALNKPFVTSNTEVLKYYFKGIAVFTKSDATQLKEKIREVLKNENELKEKMNIFLQKSVVDYKKEIDDINNYLETVCK